MVSPILFCVEAKSNIIIIGVRAIDIIARKIVATTPTSLVLKLRPFGVLLLLGQWWQEFLGRNEQ